LAAVRIRGSAEAKIGSLSSLEGNGRFVVATRASRPPARFCGLGPRGHAPSSDLTATRRLYVLLWDAHFYFAFAVFALILLHVKAALFRALVGRDGVLYRDGPRVNARQGCTCGLRAVPAEKGRFPSFRPIFDGTGEVGSRRADALSRRSIGKIGNTSFQ